MTTAPIACGVAGWSYPDWNGWVYGPGTRDKLRFVAGHVDMIEVNSTFYRPPAPELSESWVRRTEDLPGFFFAAKLHQDFTHHDRFDPATVKAFQSGVQPLVRAERLRHLLAQFRWDFADTPTTRAQLRRIHEAFGDIANLVLELRHNSWQRGDALDFARSLQATVAHLDYPLAKNSFSMWQTGVGKHAYLRLHGRNAQAWFDRKAGRDDTYNYLYSENEIERIAARATKIATMSTSLTLVANNHFQGKEMVNALELMARLAGRTVRVPPLLLEHHPRLRRIAQPS